MESTIRLFKALPIENKRKKNDEELLTKTLSKGFIFAPEVVSNYRNYDYLIELVEKAYGLSPEKLNASFHKSWAKVRDASIEQLVIEQIIHYITTYGFERLGIYDKDTVFIPTEELEIPDVELDKLELVVIKGYTKNELKYKLAALLQSGVALGEETIKDVLDVATFVGFDDQDIDQVKNKEVKAALYDYLGIVPANPVEFLRLCVYKAANTTLLIKNAALIGQIRFRNNTDISGMFEKYKKDNGLAALAQVFYRFKPIFLAFRTTTKLKRDINQVRRLAVKHHMPMAEDLLNTVTEKISRGDRKGLTRTTLTKALNEVNTFRKIRLAYALKFRTKDADSILYRIRNGKSFATEFNFENKVVAQRVLDIVLDSIVKDISTNVKGKKIYIPEHVEYALPATEKQFSGDMPSGTSIIVDEDMITGVHWENQGSHRIDLDLSVISVENGKIGWDSSYRSEDRNILFSGDITDAPKPKGASELFYLSKASRGNFIMLLNYFNFMEDVPVPFKILVAHEQVARFGENHTVDPNNVVSVTTSKITERQKVVGIIVASEKGHRFVFAEADLGNSITSYGNDYTDQARNYLVDFYTDTLSLNDILVQAGAELVDEPDEADINLAPEQVERDTILSLLYRP